MDTHNIDFDGSPPWVRLAWAGMRTLTGNSAARDIVSEAPMLAMARGLFMAITPHLANDSDVADVSLPALVAAGVGDLTMFHWLASALPNGFCQIAVDNRGTRLVGNAALDAMERYGPGLKAFYQVDLRQLRLAPPALVSPPSTGAQVPAGPTAPVAAA